LSQRNPRRNRGRGGSGKLTGSRTPRKLHHRLVVLGLRREKGGGKGAGANSGEGGEQLKRGGGAGEHDGGRVTRLARRKILGEAQVPLVHILGGGMLSARKGNLVLWA